MTTSGPIFISCVVMAMVFYFRYTRLTLGLSSTLLGLMLLLHGPAYWYYSHQWVHGNGTLFKLYQTYGSQERLDPALVSASTLFYDQLSKADQGDVQVKSGTMESNGLWNTLQRLVPNKPVEKLNLALALTFIMLCVGIWVADRVFGQCPATHQQALSCWATESRQHITLVDSKRMKLVFGAALLFLIYFLIHDDQLSKIHTYFFSHAGEFDKIRMRRAMGGGSSYIFNLSLGTVLTFFAFYLWIWLREGVQASIRWFAIGMILLIMTAKVATLSKAPAAIFILQLLILEVARRSLRVSWLAGAIFMGCAALLFSATTFIANSNLSGFFESTMFIFYRVFMIPNESLLEYFLVFPDQIKHTLGQDIRPLAILFSLEPLQSNYWRVAETLRGVGGSTTTAMFLADAWAAFSWFGVVIVPFASGFLVRWLDIELIVKRGRSCATIAGLGLGHYGIWIALSTAFQTALLTGGLALILPLIITIKWFEGKLSAPTSHQV